MKMKRFSTGKDNVDFTKPCKLTRQKRWTENPQEFVRLEHKALTKERKRSIRRCMVAYLLSKTRKRRLGSNPQCEVAFSFGV